MEEVTNCIICGSDKKIALWKARDRLHHIDGTFQLVRCTKCGLVYLSPRPSLNEMVYHYPPDYAPYARVGQGSFLRRLDVAFGIGKRCRAVNHLRTSGRILDIGCASGHFLLSMKALGWETYGVELNEYAAHRAKEHGLEVFCGEVEAAQFERDTFDVVTLWDVIEHLHSPKSTLSEINRILKKDGLLVVSTPDVGSLDANIFGRYWAGLDSPRHLFLFSAQTLSLLLQELGFEILQSKYFTGNYYTFVQSLRFFIEDMVTDSALRKVGRILINPPVVRVVLLPYFLLINRLMKGPVMTIFAGKIGDEGPRRTTDLSEGIEVV